MSAETEIRTYAERIVSLEIERRERAADIKDIKAEAKGRGYSPKLLTACVRMLLLEADKRAAALSDHEELDLYLNACGLLSGRGGEDEESPHPGFCPVAQDEGQADHAGKASDERSAGTAGSQVTEQSEEFVTTAGAGGVARAASVSAPASDDEVSPDGAYQPTPGADTSAKLDASGQRQATAAAHGSATPALGSVGSSVRGGTLTSEPVPKSGVTAGETATFVRRLLRSVDLPSDPCGCWLWNGALSTKGYGHFKLSGHDYHAHRVAHECWIGPIPVGLMVCHDCDTPQCINPNHLYAGTAADNAADMVRRGRRAIPASVILCPTAAQTIFTRANAGEKHRDLAAEFGVSEKTISNIRHGRKWGAHTTAGERPGTHTVARHSRDPSPAEMVGASA